MDTLIKQKWKGLLCGILACQALLVSSSHAQVLEGSFYAPAQVYDLNPPFQTYGPIPFGQIPAPIQNQFVSPQYPPYNEFNSQRVLPPATVGQRVTQPPQPPHVADPVSGAKLTSGSKVISKPVLPSDSKAISKPVSKPLRIVDGKVKELTKEDLRNLDELETLIEIEKRIRRILPKIQECVVSIEGGTGVIVSRSGYVLTASHVAKKAGRTVNITFADGRVVRGTTLGTNFNSDTGAVRLNPPGDWPYISITDSTLVKPGDWCIALGYPLSFKRGQPAAVRLGRVLETSENQIITDCPIMGGDSGGPLLNLSGNLIGVSSRVKSSHTQNIHIPIQIFHNDWKQLAASVDIRNSKTSSKTKTKAYLGIFGETDSDRVRVRQVHSGSPAEMAGLLAEDVILQLDGTPVQCFDDVLEILDQRKPGEEVTAKLNRFGTLLDLSIKLGPTVK